MEKNVCVFALIVITFFIILLYCYSSSLLYIINNSQPAAALAAAPSTSKGNSNITDLYPNYTSIQVQNTSNTNSSQSWHSKLVTIPGSHSTTTVMGMRPPLASQKGGPVQIIPFLTKDPKAFQLAKERANLNLIKPSVKVVTVLPPLPAVKPIPVTTQVQLQIQIQLQLTYHQQQT